MRIPPEKHEHLVSCKPIFPIRCYVDLLCFLKQRVYRIRRLLLCQIQDRGRDGSANRAYGSTPKLSWHSFSIALFFSSPPSRSPPVAIVLCAGSSIYARHKFIPFSPSVFPIFSIFHYTPTTSRPAVLCRRSSSCFLPDKRTIAIQKYFIFKFPA